MDATLPCFLSVRCSEMVFFDSCEFLEAMNFDFACNHSARRVTKRVAKKPDGSTFHACSQRKDALRAQMSTNTQSSSESRRWSLKSDVALGVVLSLRALTTKWSRAIHLVLLLPPSSPCLEDIICAELGNA